MPVHLTKEQLHEELLLRLLLLQLSLVDLVHVLDVFVEQTELLPGLVTVASGSKSIQDSISLLPVSWKSSHPLLKIHSSSVELHELHETV